MMMAAIWRPFSHLLERDFGLRPRDLTARLQAMPARISLSAGMRLPEISTGAEYPNPVHPRAAELAAAELAAAERWWNWQAMTPSRNCWSGSGAGQPGRHSHIPSIPAQHPY